MADGKSHYCQNAILEHILSKNAFTMPANVYMALCTVAPTEDDTGTSITEANYTGYARKEILATDLGNAANGIITNSGAAIVFADCTAGSSTIVGFAICDALTAGNMLYYGTTTSKTIDTNNTPATVAISGLSIQET